jgi:hypothetical protein
MRGGQGREPVNITETQTEVDPEPSLQSSPIGCALPKPPLESRQLAVCLVVTARRDRMRWQSGQPVEQVVPAIMNEIVERILARQFEVVCVLPRRAARLVDLFVSEGLRTRMEGVLVYPPVFEFVPTMIEGRSVAVVDNCVQRGTKLGDVYAGIAEKAKYVECFALARCLSHERRGQFGGVRISEPVLECTDEEFELLTSYVNYRLWNSPLPLDYEDSLIEVRLTNKQDLRKIPSLLTKVSVVWQLDGSDGSSIFRFSAFLSKDSPLLDGLRVESDGAQNDVEAKICWSAERAGMAYAVPLVLYRVKPGIVRTDLPGRLRNAAERFSSLLAQDSKLRLFRALHLAGEAILTGRVWRFLRDNSIDCDFSLRSRDLARYYGTTLGKQIASLFEDVTRESRDSFVDPHSLKMRPSTPLILDAEICAKYTDEIVPLVDKRYADANRKTGVPRLKWRSKGYTFTELLREVRATVDPQVSAERLSSFLDVALASSWLKTLSLLEEGADPKYSTFYVGTEQLPKASPDDQDLDSYARPKEFYWEVNSRSMVRMTLDLLRRVVGRDEIQIGHFFHLLTIVHKALPNRQSETLFVIGEESMYGDVVWLRPSTLTGGTTRPLEEFQQELGFQVKREGQQRFVTAAPAYSVKPTDVASDVRALLANDLYPVLSEWKEPLQTLLVYWNSCTTARSSLGQIWRNINQIGYHLKASSKSGEAPRLPTLKAIGDCIWGAEQKMRIALRSGELAAFVKGHGPLVGHTLDRNLRENLETEQTKNLTFPLYFQLLEEARTLVYQMRTCNPTLSLFGTQGGGSLLSADQLQSWSANLAQLVRQVGYFSEQQYQVLEAEAREVWSKENGRLKEGFRERNSPETKLVFVILDGVRSQPRGTGDTDDAWKTDDAARRSHDLPSFRCLASTFSGFEAEPRIGDAFYFAFEEPIQAARFIVSALVACNLFEAVARKYRITVTQGGAEFDEDGSVSSPALNRGPDLEAFGRRAESSSGENCGAIVVNAAVCSGPFFVILQSAFDRLGVPTLREGSCSTKARSDVQLLWTVIPKKLSMGEL